jgi:hypothetical protein
MIIPILVLIVILVSSHPRYLRISCSCHSIMFIHVKRFSYHFHLISSNRHSHMIFHHSHLMFRLTRVLSSHDVRLMIISVSYGEEQQQHLTTFWPPWRLVTLAVLQRWPWTRRPFYFNGYTFRIQQNITQHLQYLIFVS